jgi:hypothetical protein
MSHLSTASEADLRAELARRAKVREAMPVKFKGNYNDPVGIWQVTTEGDCEGKSVRNLGAFEGHIVDIAYALADQCYYTLTFKRTVPVPEKPKKRPTKTTIALDIDSGSWDMKLPQRASSLQQMLASKPNKGGIKFRMSPEDGSYSGNTIHFEI